VQPDWRRNQAEAPPRPLAPASLQNNGFDPGAGLQLSHPNLNDLGPDEAQTLNGSRLVLQAQRFASALQRKPVDPNQHWTEGKHQEAMERVAQGLQSPWL